MMRLLRRAGFVLTLVLVSSASFAQGKGPAPLPDIGQGLLRDPAVRAALDSIERQEARLLDEQVEICEIPAPPFKEAARGEALRQRFERLGLERVRIDGVGNVLGERPGTAERPLLVLAAHLDTVFPEESGLKMRREGTILAGPGIGDDCRGLAVMLGVIRAMNEANLRTRGRVIFVANVGEEGLGDLRGAKALFRETLKGRIDRFVSIDGSGSGITNMGVASLRYRVTFTGSGGHSFGAFGLVNPVHALGRAIAEIADFQVPSDPKTTFNVGRIGGGTSVNSIAHDAWMEVDMRSADITALKSLDARFHVAVDRAVAAENARWGGPAKLTVETQQVGERPGGQSPPGSAVVQAAISVTRALGLDAVLREGSTDSNVPFSLGVPAVTIGGGGRGTGAHSPAEAFDSQDSFKGTQRALLLTLALSNLGDGGGPR